MDVSLRPLVDADLDAIYEQMKDPESVRMAAFTAEDPADREAFLVHRSRIRADPSVVERVIEADGTFAGTIASFRVDDQTEVTFGSTARCGAEVSPVQRSRASSSSLLNAHCSHAQPRTMPPRCGYSKRPGSDASALIAASPAVAVRRSRR